MNRAWGLLDLGGFEGAWLAIDDMEPEHRAHPGPRQIRVRAATGLKKWDIAEAIVSYFDGSQVLSHRETVGRFHLEYARDLFSQGEAAKARAQIRLLSTVWPEGRLQVLDDPCLLELL